MIRSMWLPDLEERSSAQKNGQLERLAAVAALVTGAWSALAVTQPIFENINEIAAKLTGAVNSMERGDVPAPTFAKIISLRADYWFLAVSLPFYFLFIGLIVFLVSFYMSASRRSIRITGMIFFVIMLIAAFFSALFEGLTACALKNAGILDWADHGFYEVTYIERQETETFHSPNTDPYPFCSIIRYLEALVGISDAGAPVR